MFNEQFWLAAAFLVFCGLFFKKMKKVILDTLNARIKKVEKFLSEAEEEKNKAEKELITLKASYEKSKLEAQMNLEEAKSQAKALLDDIEKKIQLHHQTSENLFAEYVKQADHMVVESLKSEVLVTIFTLLDKDFENKDEQIRGLDLIKQLLKKSWH
jgi:F0F1-type ATP synthase membrane subunit b/b'